MPSLNASPSPKASLLSKFQQISIITILTLGLFTALLIVNGSAHAADKKDQNKPDNSGWAASMVDNLKNTNLTSQQQKVVLQINTYLNNLNDLKGRFIQINPDDSQQKGKFYLKRPGRIRFDYAPPSLQRVIADGRFLIIEDRDINTEDRFPLKNTPFRILLAKEVNIVRDAIIKSVVETDEQTSIILIDRNGSAIGEIELVFANTPNLELKEWKVIDAQGQTTRVILSHLNFDEKIDGKLFQREKSTKSLSFP